MAEYKIIGNFGSSFSNSDNITLSVDSGTITPSSVTKAELEGGITVNVDEGATITATVVNGTCYSIADNLTTTPSTAPLPSEDPYEGPTFNGWKFTAGKTSIFGIDNIGYHRGLLYNCPSTYGIGYGVSPTSTQLTVNGTNCLTNEYANLDKGFGIIGYGSVSNLALTQFSAVSEFGGVPCYNINILENTDIPPTIISSADFIETDTYPLSSLLLYWYDYECNRYEYLYSKGKIYVKSRPLVCLGAPWIATSVDSNSPGAASCASGFNWYDTSLPSGAGLFVFPGATFPYIDKLPWEISGNELSGAYVKVNNTTEPTASEFAICYQNLYNYSYIDCDGSEVSATLTQGSTENLCVQSIVSSSGGITVENSGTSCTDNTGVNSIYNIYIGLINSNGSGNAGSGTIGGNIVGDNNTSGTWSATYTPELSYVDNNGNGSTITPVSTGPVTLAGISLENGVTYTITVE